MITIHSGGLASVDALLRTMSTRLPNTISRAVDDVLDDVIRQLQAVTPVRSGKMFADYRVEATSGMWELQDTAQSPAGYDYPSRIVGEAGFSQAYDALNSVLDHAEIDLVALLENSIARMTTTAP